MGLLAVTFLLIWFYIFCRRLCEELLSRVPTGKSESCEDAQRELEVEVESFVDDFLQLMQARLVQTPLSDCGQSPMQVVGKYGIYKKVYSPDMKSEENSGLLGCLMRQVKPLQQKVLLSFLYQPPDPSHTITPLSEVPLEAHGIECLLWATAALLC